MLVFLNVFFILDNFSSDDMDFVSKLNSPLPTLMKRCTDFHGGLAIRGSLLAR